MSRRKRYRGTSLIRNSVPLGPYSRTVPRALRWSWGGVAVSYERKKPVFQADSVDLEPKMDRTDFELAIAAIYRAMREVPLSPSLSPAAEGSTLHLAICLWPQKETLNPCRWSSGSKRLYAYMLPSCIAAIADIAGYSGYMRSPPFTEPCGRYPYASPLGSP